MRTNLTIYLFAAALASLPINAEETTEPPISAAPPDAIQLIGSEQSIQGVYHARCLDRSSSNVCWLRITEQAENDLRIKLLQNYNNLATITVVYRDFEGFQRDSIENGRLLIEADGTFFFDIKSANAVSTVTITRQSKQTPKALKPDRTAKKQDNGLDISLFYVWDDNNSADSNALAISSARYGIGLWTQNRVGFAAFKGTDTIGVAKTNGAVVNTKARYETTGVGVGFRLWSNRSVTLENHIYYVDAQPLLASLTNVCETCTDRSFESQNYVQTSVNLKTNSKGLNIGWMLTWKWLEETPNADRLSSGFYLEALF